MNARGPRYDGCVNASGPELILFRGQQGPLLQQFFTVVPVGERRSKVGRPREEALPVDPVARPRYAVDPRLGVQPLRGSSQLSFARSMISGGPIGKRTTSPTDGHSPVGLRKVMFIEPNTELLFW